MTRRKKSMDERLLRDYEAGELVSAAPTKAELKKYRDAARATLAKNRRVNIRLSSSVLTGIQARAMEEGLPYQTLIASILHKYVTGRLAEQQVPSAPRPVRRTPRRNAA